MATIIRITPVREVVNILDGGEFKPVERRRCIRVEDYRNYEITYDADGKRLLEARI